MIALWAPPKPSLDSEGTESVSGEGDYSGEWARGAEGSRGVGGDEEGKEVCSPGVGHAHTKPKYLSTPLEFPRDWDVTLCSRLDNSHVAQQVWDLICLPMERRLHASSSGWEDREAHDRELKAEFLMLIPKIDSLIEDHRTNTRLLESYEVREQNLSMALRIAREGEERLQGKLREEKEGKEKFKKDVEQSAEALRKALEDTKNLEDKLDGEKDRAIKEFLASPEFGEAATKYTIPLFGDMVEKMAKEFKGQDPPINPYSVPSLRELLPPLPTPEAET